MFLRLFDRFRRVLGTVLGRLLVFGRELRQLGRLLLGSGHELVVLLRHRGFGRGCHRVDILFGTLSLQLNRACSRWTSPSPVFFTVTSAFFSGPNLPQPTAKVDKPISTIASEKLFMTPPSMRVFRELAAIRKPRNSVTNAAEIESESSAAARLQPAGARRMKAGSLVAAPSNAKTFFSLVCFAKRPRLSRQKQSRDPLDSLGQDLVLANEL